MVVIVSKKLVQNITLDDFRLRELVRCHNEAEVKVKPRAALLSTPSLPSFSESRFLKRFTLFTSIAFQNENTPE